jgi:ABC-2 type transport system ATP-binding protein
MSETTVIQIRDLVKNYGKVQALRGVNLEVNGGEVFGFLGPNGAGKTTTIRCMLDIIRPQAGSISVLGMDPQKAPVSVRSKVGYLPGELNMEANLKVEGALRYYNDLRSNNVDWAFTRQLAERLDLDLSVPIKNLSKGNKQKVGVVQALMSRPKLLMMDEPTSGLDPLMQQEVYRMLRDAQSNGATIFFSSHIINEVEAIADRVAIISNGVIIEEAEPGKLIDMEIRRIRVAFKDAVEPSSLSAVGGVSILSRDDGNVVTLQVEGELDGLIKALGSFPVIDMNIERPSLEEVFLTYYKSSEKEVN